MFEKTKGDKQADNKDSFLKQADEARQQRSLDKRKISAAIQIQSYFRGWSTRFHLKRSLSDELKAAFVNTGSESTSRGDIGSTQLNVSKTNDLSALQIFELVRKLIVLDNLNHHTHTLTDLKTIQNICAYVTLSITSGDFKHSYVSLIVSKDNYTSYLSQSHRLLQIVLSCIPLLQIKTEDGNKSFGNILCLIGTLCDYRCWKCLKAESNVLVETILKETTKSYMNAINRFGLFAKFNSIWIQNSTSYQPLLKTNTMISMLNHVFKILQIRNFDTPTLNDFCKYVLTVPLLFNMFADNSQDIQLAQLKQSVVCEFSLNTQLYLHLSNPHNLDALISNCDVNYLICFLGNLCSLSRLSIECVRNNAENFIFISSRIFTNSIDMLAKAKSTKNADTNDTIRWHPIFGFLKIKSSFRINLTSCTLSNFEILVKVMEQLRFLWSHQFISILLDSTNLIFNNITNNNFKDFIRTFFDRTIKRQTTAAQSSVLDVAAIESASLFRICSFYRQILIFFAEPRIEILSALSIEEEFLLGLWHFLCSLGPQCGLSELFKTVQLSKNIDHQIFDVVYLISSLVLYLVTVLDENEFYVKQTILKLNDYKTMASFLNNLIYKIVSTESIDCKTLDSNSFFSVFHQLLTALHMKDTRRSFTDETNTFWIIKEIRGKTFMSDLEKEKKYTSLILQYIPHVIPLKNRIEILRSRIEKEKHSLHGSESPQVRVNIRRNKLVEDAFFNLSTLPANLLKSTIRISFVNDYVTAYHNIFIKGLREAGIDQDGVFKEFLQETIKQLLDPKFNLFQITSNQQLCPSPSSYFVDDHLQMFEFAGKMIGKSIYEGQVLDVEFASFFLRQLVGYKTQYYSFLDDLATLDNELYKNLNSIKHEESVSDLELTFTHSELHLGKLISHELIPSGNIIKVTNENKIKYIHLLAHFKLHKQIKEQINSFNEGFKSIIKQEWLNLFSLPEFSILIAGSVHDINLDDLKQHVQYWNGLHGSHRLIKWLWDILENDFSREERSLFLKFVTSSPKPPLLGFSSLNPPFSIRCIESEEEDGTIYDSSFRSFFKTIMNISGNDTSRLPTSSTCFNLLKLPNYSKKSTLKEKLRYAINSNSGFELS